MNPDKIDRELLVGLPKRIFRYTDLIAYTVNIPLTLIAVLYMLDLSAGNAALLCAIVAVLVAIALFLTRTQLRAHQHHTINH